jgi:hypothetical protein
MESHEVHTLGGVTSMASFRVSSLPVITSSSLPRMVRFTL